MLKILEKFDKYFLWVENKILVIIPFLLTLLTISAVFNRYFIKRSMSWYEEIAIYSFMLLTYWGISNIARDDAHLSVDFLKSKFRGKSLIYLKIVIWSIASFVSLCGVYFGMRMSLITNMKTIALKIPYSIILFSTLVMSFFGMSVRYLYKIINALKNIEKDEKKESL